MIIQAINKNLYHVKLSRNDVDELYTYLSCMDDYGIELIEGINTLEKDTLWLILCELSKINYHSQTTFQFTDKLKMVLYPAQ